MSIEEKLKELGIELKSPPTPVAVATNSAPTVVDALHTAATSGASTAVVLIDTVTVLVDAV